LIRTEPINRIIKFARAMGFTYLFLGVILTILMLSISDALRPGRERPFVVVMVVVNLLYCGSGLTLIWLARKLDNGAIWTAYVITALASVLLCFTMLAYLRASARTGDFCAFTMLLALNLPTLLLIGVCFSAFPELKHQRRADRRQIEQFTGGFPVIANTNKPVIPMANIKTPPRPNTIRRDRGT
jgi:cytochrome bd-type quinol oxidase subunit 2